MRKPILGLRASPTAGYGERGFTWRDHIPSVAHVGQRWFPSMNYLGAPLFGSVMSQGGVRTTVMLPLLNRVLLFLEMLEVVEVSEGWRELLAAVVYRRQVTESDCKAIDEPLLRLACRARPKFTSHEWGMLTERMPLHTRIRRLTRAIENHSSTRDWLLRECEEPLLTAAE